MNETKSIHQFKVKTIDGKEVSLSVYTGKTLLIINTASKCGFTPQYEGLQTLYQKYQSRGFEVLAFPANDFMSQEPGTNAEIKQFCTVKYHVTFPVFAKIHVKGKDIEPLYEYLTKESEFKGDISWNFNKFLVNGNGEVVGRFGSRTEPLDEEVTSQIETSLNHS